MGAESVGFGPAIEGGLTPARFRACYPAFNMNPYASCLGNRDPLEVIATTAGRLKELLDGIGRKQAEDAPAPGKWSCREILCHLADCEIAFAFRIRQALAEDHYVIQPFDQEKWAKPYAAYEARRALEVFSTLREWNRTLLKAVLPGALSKPLAHPERGEMTFKVLIETMAGHDINHLRQIEAIRSRSAVA